MNPEFDIEKGMEIMNQKLGEIKRIMQLIEEDLNSKDHDRYHSGAIATEVLWQYFDRDSGNFIISCNQFCELLRSHQLDAQTVAH